MKMREELLALIEKSDYKGMNPRLCAGARHPARGRHDVCGNDEGAECFGGRAYFSKG